MKYTLEKIPQSYQSNYQRLEKKFQEIQQLIKVETQLNIIFIDSSDYRDPLHNKRCGGVQNSQHTKAEALDFQPQNYDINKIYEIIQRHQSDLQLDQLILEQDDKDSKKFWIHFSISDPGKNARLQAFHAIKGGHVTKFQQIQNNIIGTNSTSQTSIISNIDHYDKNKPFLSNLANIDSSEKSIHNLATITSQKDLVKRMSKNEHLNKLLIVANKYRESSPQVKS